MSYLATLGRCCSTFKRGSVHRFVVSGTCHDFDTFDLCGFFWVVECHTREMKRHRALQPFSRDHNVALILSRDLSRAPEADDVLCQALADRIGHYWRDELEDHFAEEERLLTPLARPSSARRLADEHRDIAARIRVVAQQAQAETLRNLGTLLEAHVRWEERCLFVEIEEDASSEQLAQLLHEANAIEQRRAESTWAPRRGELASRRIDDST